MLKNGSDGNSLATPCSSAWEDVASRIAGRRPIQKIPIEKARGRFPGAGSILAMMKICR
jgi:hypothetical protein